MIPTDHDISDQVRNCVQCCGVDLVAALHAASRTPAKILNRTDIGEIRVGMWRQPVLLILQWEARTQFSLINAYLQCTKHIAPSC